MMKKLLLLLLACLLLTGCTPDLSAEEQARQHLAKLGIEISAETLEAYRAQTAESLAYLQSLPDMPQEWLDHMSQRSTNVRAIARELLIYVGTGDENYDTGEWTPASTRVYAFDAEVFDVDRMYARFLQGVDVIVPDAAFTDVTETIHAAAPLLSLFSDGTRTVSFLCNGHPYTLTLQSQSDWIDPAVIGKVNAVLEQEGCAGRLYEVAAGWDQMVILVYGTEPWARKLDAALGGSFE